MLRVGLYTGALRLKKNVRNPTKACDRQEIPLVNKFQICQKTRYLFDTDLVLSHPNFLNRLVKKMGFSLVYQIHSLIGK